MRVGEDRDEGGDVILALDLAPVPPGVEVRLVLVLDPPVVLFVVVDLAAVRQTLKWRNGAIVGGMQG